MIGLLQKCIEDSLFPFQSKISYKSSPRLPHFSGFCGIKTGTALRLVYEELDQKLDHTIIQTHHSAVLHTIIELQALRAPQEIFSGVVNICLRGESHRVQLVAEEREILSICDHSLRHERPGDVFTIPESCRLK